MIFYTSPSSAGLGLCHSVPGYPPPPTAPAWGFPDELCPGWGELFPLQVRLPAPSRLGSSPGTDAGMSDRKRQICVSLVAASHGHSRPLPRPHARGHTRQETLKHRPPVPATAPQSARTLFFLDGLCERLSGRRHLPVSLPRILDQPCCWRGGFHPSQNEAVCSSCVPLACYTQISFWNEGRLFLRLRITQHQPPRGACCGL